MSKKSVAALTPATQTERTEELVGVLTAISVVSKRLARKLALLERRSAGKEGKRGDGSAGRNISAHAD